MAKIDADTAKRMAEQRKSKLVDHKCPDCPLTFKYPRMLQKHGEKVHGWTDIKVQLPVYKYKPVEGDRRVGRPKKASIIPATRQPFALSLETDNELLVVAEALQHLKEVNHIAGDKLNTVLGLQVRIVEIQSKRGNL